MDRQAVVLLHGALGAGDDWRLVERALAASHRVLVPELLGRGAWPPVADPYRYGVADEAASMLSRLAARLGAQARVTLVGIDYGAVVALEMARQQPARVERMVLHEPTRFDLLDDPADRAFVESVRRPVEMLVSRGLEHGAARMFHDFWNGPGDFDRLAPEARERLARGAAKLVLELRAMCEPPPGEMPAAALRVPTALVGGRRSFVITRRVLERLAGSLRNASLEWIEGDHLSPLREPAEFLRIVGGALAAEPRAA